MDCLPEVVVLFIDRLWWNARAVLGEEMSTHMSSKALVETALSESR